MTSKTKQKCVILITIDALRPDHLRSYGYHRDTAPNLEKFFQEGTKFLNAITNGPETPSGFSAIFTSTLPFLDGGYSPLPLYKITFPQILNENGIYTYGIHSNPNLGRFFNYNRGFDTFLDGERYKVDFNLNRNFNLKQIFSFYIKKILDYKNFIQRLIYRLKGFNKIKNWLRGKFPFLTDILLPFTPIAYNAPYIVNKLMTSFPNLNKPFFIWAHFMDAHGPYNPPTKNILKFRKSDFDNNEKEFLSNKIYFNFQNFKITQDTVENIKLLYDSEINFIDDSLEKLLQYLKVRFKNNCLIIVTADHGEGFYEHCFFGHQGIIYEELLKIPLFIIELGKVPNVKVVHDHVQLIDIAPTILDYFSIKIPENYQGTSFLPLIEGKLLKQDKYIISECYQKDRKIKRNREEGYILLSIRKGDWKYIYDEEDSKEFLFNLKDDQFEKDNLINKNTTKLNEFKEIKNLHIQKSVTSALEKSKILNAIDSLNFNKLKNNT
ncbi:MAG: sulfatase-like hydrolase/transferase [Promethearchaeota archaeon]